MQIAKIIMNKVETHFIKETNKMSAQLGFNIEFNQKNLQKFLVYCENKAYKNPFFIKTESWIWDEVSRKYRKVYYNGEFEMIFYTDEINAYVNIPFANNRFFPRELTEEERNELL